MQVAHPRTGHQLAVEQLLDQRRIIAHGSTVEITRDRGGVVVIQEPAWGQHLRQHQRVSRHHDCTRAGGHQDQPPAATRVLKRELLGQRPAPGHTENIHLAVESKLLQQAAKYGNPYGRGEFGDPPVPGTSNRTTVVSGSRCATSGSSTSRLAPMPLHNTSGMPVPSRTFTRICWPRTGIRCSTVKLFEAAAVMGTTR